MQNLMIIDDQKAKISYDPDIGLFRGEFINLNGGADFYSDSIEGLEREGKQSLATFLEVCAEEGIEPYKTYSGKFMTRLPSDVHEQIATLASSQGVSLNQWVNNTLTSAVQQAR